MLNISEIIKQKKEIFGITDKEFADALCLGREGEKLLKAWLFLAQTPRMLKCNHAENTDGILGGKVPEECGE